MIKKIVLMMMLTGIFSIAEAAKIGLVISNQNKFFTKIKAGAGQMAAGLGHEVIVLSSEDDISKERANVEAMIDKKVDLLLITPIDSDKVAPAIKEATRAKIPVITLYKGANVGNVESRITSDNVQAGRMAGEYLLKMLPENANVVELEGVSGEKEARDRAQGFNEVISRKLNVVESKVADYDELKGGVAMRNIIRDNPKIDGVFAHNDKMALGAIIALEAAGKKDVVVVGFGGTDEGIDAVKEGKMAATIIERPAEIGATGVAIGDQVLKKWDVEQYILLDLDLVINGDSVRQNKEPNKNEPMYKNKEKPMYENKDEPMNQPMERSPNQKMESTTDNKMDSKY